MEKKKNKSKKQTKKSKNKKPKFENCINLVDEEIKKRRSKWNLTALAWLDFDDVSQIIRLHIFNKWDQYDPKQPLAPWLNRIITNQIKNLIRNNYTNFIKPCARCEAAKGEDGCKIYETQCSACPLYKNWEKNKKAGYAAKMPVPLENYKQEVYHIKNHSDADIEKAGKKLHKRMKEVLKPHEWKIYQYLYIDFMEELDVAKKMGYKTSEKNRSPGYKQIKNVKKKIMIKVKEVLSKEDIDLF
jgi:DNA-directed RNA polymerase specialized sigma24 family protein